MNLTSLKPLRLEGEGAGAFDTDLSLTPDEVSLPSDNLAETLEPLGGQEAEEVALLSPQEVGQSEESGPTSGEPEPEPEVGGVGPESDAGTETPPQRTAQRIATPSGQMRGLGQLIRQIRAVPQPQCSLLLPRRSQSAGLGLSMVGTDDIVLNAAADRVVARVDSTVQRNLEIIDLRQCAALDALRQSAAYPASRLGLALEQAYPQQRRSASGAGDWGRRGSIWRCCWLMTMASCRTFRALPH